MCLSSLSFGWIRIKIEWKLIYYIKNDFGMQICGFPNYNQDPMDKII